MSDLRLGIIGYGNMGKSHVNAFGEIKGAMVAAICDSDPGKAEQAAKAHNVATFIDHKEMLASGAVDAVLVAVPHYEHVPITIHAFEKNVHVLVEKPVAVSVSAAREVNKAYEKYPHLKFGIMFNQRTKGLYRKMRELIVDGELGEITRVTWLVTNWFRTHTYYASGGWRATWKGEGGGVMINQCPHNLDLLQWICGGLMPNRVTAVGAVGKTHPIEVEDEMSAILEYPNGAIGHFVTSTGEYPGTNRLEICGDRGKLIAEQGKLKFYRTRKSVSDVNRNSPDAFTGIETWEIEVAVPASPGIEHNHVIQRFVDVVRDNRPNKDLVAEGTEGANGLEIGNAMMMSGLLRKPVELPLDGAAYDQFLIDMDKKYGGKKTLVTKKVEADLAASFAR
jgi:predicted dehydrogenase